MADRSLSENFDLVWRLACVYGVISLLVMFDIVSLSIPLASQVRPSFLLIVTMYCAVYRPALFSPVLIFAAGLLSDFLTGQSIIGTQAFILLLVFIAIRDQRLYLMAQPFVVVWLFFAITAVGAALLHWMLSSLFHFQIFSILPPLSESCVNIFIFPLVAAVLNMCFRVLPRHIKTSL